LGSKFVSDEAAAKSAPASAEQAVPDQYPIGTLLDVHDALESGEINNGPDSSSLSPLTISVFPSAEEVTKFHAPAGSPVKFHMFPESMDV
jgi:hypothetical protein